MPPSVDYHHRLPELHELLRSNFFRDAENFCSFARELKNKISGLPEKQIMGGRRIKRASGSPARGRANDRIRKALLFPGMSDAAGQLEPVILRGGG